MLAPARPPIVISASASGLSGGGGAFLRLTGPFHENPPSLGQALLVEDQPAGCRATCRAGGQWRPCYQRSIEEVSMFTSIDKALVAAIMGILFIVQT